MRRPTSLLLLLMTSSVLAQDPPAPPPPPRGVVPVPKEGGWMKRHEEFVATAKKGPIPVLFLGDSITEGWYRKDIRKIWDERFAPLSAANFGISGDRTQHVLWRLKNGEFDNQTPKVVVLLIGINNIGQKDPEPPESAAAGIEAVVGEIRRRSPTTKILLQAVFPAGERPDHPYRAGVRRINELAAKLDDGGKTVRFLDFGKVFLSEDGTISKEVMPDFLHLSERGYRLWADAIKEPLAELLR